ncbi:MAG: 50S ribosomal protein L32 [Candidatus Dependentiae bacterium]
MPVPKRKRSRPRRDKRFANWGLKVKAIARCQQCEHPMPAHQLCKECGYYKGRKVLVTKTDRAEKRGETRKAKEALEAKKAETQQKEAK